MTSRRACQCFIVLSRNDRTIVRGGIGLFYTRGALAERYFEPENLNEDDDRRIDNQLGIDSHSQLPGANHHNLRSRRSNRSSTDRALFLNVISEPFQDARSLRWSLQVDRRVTKGFDAADRLRSSSYKKGTHNYSGALERWRRISCSQESRCFAIQRVPAPRTI
jgi:hypothetical protein